MDGVRRHREFLTIRRRECYDNADDGLDAANAFACELVDPSQAVEERRDLSQRIGIWTVTEGIIGILMDFHKHRIDTDRGRRSRQWRNELALAARSFTAGSRPGKLHR